jgi:addiction module HigA family antidote
MAHHHAGHITNVVERARGQDARDDVKRAGGGHGEIIASSLILTPYRLTLSEICYILITADTALRLARYFGNSPRFWMGLQADYDLDLAEDAFK